VNHVQFLFFVFLLLLKAILDKNRGRDEESTYKYEMEPKLNY